MDNIIDYSEILQSKFSQFLEKYPKICGKPTKPSDYLSHERRIAISIANHERVIEVPDDEMIAPVIDFILDIPIDLWDDFNIPLSLLKRNIFRGANEMLGTEFAESATALVKFFGSFEVFTVLHSHYVFTNGKLIWSRI